VTITVRRAALGFRQFKWSGRWAEVRLHRWGGPGRPDVHGEKRSFVSLVLHGELTETRWRLTDDGNHLLYGCSGGNDLTSLGRRVGLQQVAVHVRRAGHLYRMRVGDLHSVQARPGTVTVNLRGPVRQRTVPVVRR
jgi:hypothetical protein